MIRIRILGIALSLAASSAAASLADETPHRWYVGASYGTSSLQHGIEEFSDRSIQNAKVDDSDTGWKLLGGLRLRRHLSIELGFVDLNNDFDGETTLAGSSDGSGDQFGEGPIGIDLDEPRATVVALVGDLAITRRATLLGKAGATAWQANLTTTDSVGDWTRGVSGTDATLGIGLQYRLASRTELRVEWERFFDVAGVDIDLGSLGVVVRPGR